MHVLRRPIMLWEGLHLLTSRTLAARRHPPRWPHLLIPPPRVACPLPMTHSPPVGRAGAAQGRPTEPLGVTQGRQPWGPPFLMPRRRLGLMSLTLILLAQACRAHTCESGRSQRTRSRTGATGMSSDVSVACLSLPSLSVPGICRRLCVFQL
jgi:hypothetical protein